MRSLRNKSAFTLVELMIVIAVISILATIVMPKMTLSRSRAELAACKNNLQAIAKAAEMYATANNNAYPATCKLRLGTGVLITQGYIKFMLCPSDKTSDPLASGYSYYYILDTPTHYYVYCRYGVHTAVGVPVNYPRFDPALGGLVDH